MTSGGEESAAGVDLRGDNLAGEWKAMLIQGPDRLRSNGSTRGGVMGPRSHCHPLCLL